jgi:PAS domain S-box-containing protein
MRDMYDRRLMGGVCVDVTESVRAETALRTSEAKFRAVSESATDAIIATDQYAQVISWNPAAMRMFGFTPDEMIGQPLEKIVPQRYRQAQRSGLARVLAYGPSGVSSHPSELTGLRKDGGEFPIELSIGFWQDAEELFFTGIVRDATDRKRAEEELRKRDEQLAHSQRLESLGTLAGGVAHEFNNLLQSIQGYTHYAREGLGCDDPRRQDLDLVLKAAERATTLTRQLLGFSRRQRLQYEDLDPNQIVQEAAHLLRPLIGEHIQLELQLADGVGTIHADAANLQQLLMNLAINARDAMPDGGRLLIRTEQFTLAEPGVSQTPNLRAGEYLRLVVSDTGCGMSSEVLEHAFEPFFTTKEVGRGTGLGLASVYGVVTQHHGAIRVESHPERGTTLEILLPLVEGSRRAAGNGAKSVAAGGRETILLAEDEPLVRDLVVRKLEAAGYRVLTAGDGGEALEKFIENREQISLVILDLVMPRMGGREAYDRMREIEPAVKVIFATAYDSETAGLGCLERNGIGFIQKPADGPTLLTAIRETLDAPAQIAAYI